MKRFWIILLFIFVLGIACSFIPLSINLSIRNLKDHIEPAVKTVSTQETSLPPVDKIAPTSVASGVLEKINEITTQSSSIKFPTPEISAIPFPKDPLSKSNGMENSKTFNYHTQNPAYLSNFLNPEKSCEITELVGQVFGEHGEPLEGMVVIVKDHETELPLEYIGYSGVSQSIGPAGYEIVLTSISSQKKLSIQLFNKDGEILSDSFELDVFPDCEKNLVVVNFYFDDKNLHIYFPLIGN
ncbi:MAG: hypothetical protein ACYDH1_01205 [Anaerolineaceae bacterium]